MIIMSVESTCDETAVALVRDGREILADKIYSQADLHAIYGGVVPEIASRHHVEAIYQLADSAIEAADAVIISDNLARLSDTVRIARKTLNISKQNIVFAIGIKLLAMLLVATGIVGMWMAVFADVGVAVLAILNSMRTLK